MAITFWLCKSNTKHMFVKIVHPGSHVELHDRPVLAAEIMQRNPRSVLAHPNVFQQPWAIVAPETTLMLGQKFYVVPMSTIRKLQRHYLRYSPSPVHSMQIQINNTGQQCSDHRGDGEASPSCCLSTYKNTMMSPCSGSKKSEVGEKGLSGVDGGCMNLVSDKRRGNNRDDVTDGSSQNSAGSSETRGLTKPRRKEPFKGLSSTKMLMSIEWQPKLESITEE